MNINIHYNYTIKDDQVSSHNSQINAFCTALKRRNAQYNFVNYLQKSLFAANVIADFDYSIFLKAFDKSRYFSLLYE